MCGKPYTYRQLDGEVGTAPCNRDKGHEDSDDEDYRECGYEDRTPF